MIEAGSHRCEDLEARREALRDVLEQADRELLFYAPRLEGRLVEDPVIHRKLQDFMLASPRHHLRILVVEAAALVRDCPRLIALCRRLPSRCQLRVPGTRTEPLDESLYCADRHHALHRPPMERSLHIHHAAQPIKVDPLRKRIEALWDESREAADFRQLDL